MTLVTQLLITACILSAMPVLIFALNSIVMIDLLSALLTLWACLYVAAPFVEELWMKENYGAEFEDYMADVPRFGSPAALTGVMLTQLELKLPPLMIIVVCAGVMYWCAQSIQHEMVLAASLRVVLGGAAGVIALIILIAALLTFRRHQTTINPLDPRQTQSIVSAGIYLSLIHI